MAEALEKYTVSVRVKAIIQFPVQATSLEEALEAGRERVSKETFFAKGVEYIDGNEEVIGAQGDWDL